MFERLGINTVRMRNFKTVGNKAVEFTFEDGTLTLISGHNGCGKSTIVDAVHFCLFGRSIHDVKLGELVNTVNRKECVVEVDLSRGGCKYTIRRGIKPGILEIEKDGKPLEARAKKKDDQEFINLLVGMSSHTFRNVVILSEDMSKRFMDLSASERRDMVEELMNICIFGDMLEVCKKYASGAKEEIQSIEVQWAAANTKAMTLSQTIHSQEAVLINWEGERRRDLESARSQMTTLEEEISAINGAIEKSAGRDFDLMISECSKLMSAARERHSAAVRKHTLAKKTRDDTLIAVKRAAAEKSGAEVRVRVAEEDLAEAEKQLISHRERFKRTVEKLASIGDISKINSDLKIAEIILDAARSLVATTESELKQAVEKDRLVSAGKCPTCGQEVCEDKFHPEVGSVAGVTESLDSAKKAAELAKAEVEELREKVSMHSKYTLQITVVAGDVKEAESAFSAAEQSLNHANQVIASVAEAQAVDTLAMEAEIISIENEISDAEEEISRVENSLDGWKDEKNRAASRAEQLSGKMKQLEAASDLLQRVINRQRPVEPAKEELVNAQNDLKRVTKEKEVADKQRRYIDIAKQMLSDKEIRANIISTYLPYLNKKINEYLEEFELSVGFEFSSTFEPSFKARYRDELGYGAFSAGQRTRINLSIAFAFMDLAARKSTVHTNLLFLDEILDSHLDGRGCDIVLGVLRRKAINEGLSVQVISHRTSLTDGFDREFQVSKPGHFTSIKRIR